MDMSGCKNRIYRPFLFVLQVAIGRTIWLAAVERENFLQIRLRYDRVDTIT